MKDRKSRAHLKAWIRVSNSLDPDQAKHSDGTDLGPICSQKLTSDHTRIVK